MTERSHPEPPFAGDETATLLGSLERQRATLAWKCGGLDAEGLRTRLEPSDITLGGLLKHLAQVEDFYFRQFLLGLPPSAPWDVHGWDVDPEWDWRSAAEDSPQELVSMWQDAVARSRAAVDEALAEGDMGRLTRVPRGDTRASLRRIFVDVIEEYARHVGHADLIRESIDGLVGEDPPGD